MSEQLKQTVGQLFDLFSQGEWDEAAKLFSPDVKITQQFGAEIKTVDLETFISSAKHGPLSKVGHPVYEDRVVQIIGNTGFVEQHTTCLTIGQTDCRIPVCIVGAFDTEGKIIQIEEYLDPSPIMRALGAS